ncbi:MAG: aspartate aminotransferase family protein [Pseudomonadota bacterium]
MTMSLPEKGRAWPELKEQMVGAKADDYAWERGRLPLYVYWRDEELGQVAREASSLFFVENGMGKRAFPSVQKLEQDVITMVLGLMQAGPAAAGNFTSGGTESIFLAVKTARDFARARRPDIGKPRIVLARSAHPAFNKAAHYLDMDVIRVPLRDDFRADVDAMANALDDNTVLIVGSAPAYPHGVFDPIEALADLARAHDLWLHVDACVGGLLSPFVRRLGYDIPPFDFAVDGVTSMSADLHKYGFTAKGASVLMFHDKSLQEHLRFTFDEWPRGIYATDTFLGTRPASPVASAWAVMNYLGEEGYLDIARTTMTTKARFAQGLAAIPGLEVLEPNELSFLLYRSNDPDLNIDAVADGMTERGWFVGRCVEPPSIQLMFNPVHAEIIGEYLDDLAIVVDQVRSTGRVGVLDKATY